MNVQNDEMIDCEKKELTSIVMRLTNVTEDEARQISNEIANAIDWDDLALMEKGLSWMVKNYLAANVGFRPWKDK